MKEAKKQKSVDRSQKTEATGRGVAWFLFCVCLLTPGLLLADFVPDRWTSWRDIQAPDTPAGSEFALAPLDGAVFDAARPDLRDLRVVDEHGVEIASRVFIVHPPLFPAQKPALLPASMPSVAPEAGEKSNTYEIDLGHRHLPSQRLEIASETRNFRRRVTLRGSNDNKEWRDIGAGEISSISIGKTRQQQLALDYNEAQYRYLRLRVFDYDDQPLRISAARVYGWPRQLLFRRQAGARYRLFYGNKQAQAPRYDLDEVASYLKFSSLPVATLGPAQGNAAFTDSPASAATSRAPQPAWVWAALAITAIVLSTLIYRLARLSGKKDEQENSSTP
ncbi:MAG: DUF3999 family protein [Blastocatellia bacterium]